MSVSFQEELRLLLDSQPFAAQVTMVGPIFDKVQLEEEYRKAKIFCLTSLVECYAHVFAEAPKNGCYIVTTDVDGAADITQQQRFGTIHPTHDWEAMGLDIATSCKTGTIVGRYLCPAPSICPQ